LIDIKNRYGSRILDNLFWLLLTAIVLLYWWHSGNFKGRARALAVAHCQQFKLQLLDQSVVICGIWPEIDTSGKLTLRRKYQFEFTSTGEHRYQGFLVLSGMNLKSIELEAFKIADTD
jgi:hypothetical protein